MGSPPEWDESDDTTTTSSPAGELLAQIPKKPSFLELVKGPGAPSPAVRIHFLLLACESMYSTASLISLADQV